MASEFIFSQRSENNLRGVHQDLVSVVRLALELSTIDFGITEGLRTVERQEQLVAEGKSQTMNSRHLSGHAIDVFAYPAPAGSWDGKWYQRISEAFKQAGKELGTPVEWGGDWKTLKDGPHFQLPYADYPA
ncbi:MAG: M15 family metallopeptidase [Leclercia sp.]